MEETADSGRTCNSMMAVPSFTNVVEYVMILEAAQFDDNRL